MGSQNIVCTASDCRFWSASEDGCIRESVTIEKQHCLDYERGKKVQFTVVVSGGEVQTVYTSLPGDEVLVNILDYDKAKREGPEAAEEMAADEDHAQSIYNKAY